MNHQQKSERDELRARFTVWLETTVYRARLKYLEREKPKVDTVSIEELRRALYLFLNKPHIVEYQDLLLILKRNGWQRRLQNCQ